MYKTERPFRVDVHRNSLFSSGEGWGGEGRGVFCDFVLCRYCKVGKVYTSYYIHFLHV